MEGGETENAHMKQQCRLVLRHEYERELSSTYAVRYTASQEYTRMSYPDGDY